MLGIRVHGLAYILTQQTPTQMATNMNHPRSAAAVPGFPVAGVFVAAPARSWVPKRPTPGRAHLVVVK